jgi:subtilase family serine protease
LRDDARSRALMAARALADGSAAPMTAGAAAKTYTPAQIRAAYGLPGLPAAGATPTAAQAAQLGAGQTIYLIDAMHDPNAAAELAVFNATFGLPACTTRAIAASASLPLAAAGVGEGCALSVVYGSANGAMTSTAPAFDAGWATEIALDLQWAHAAAPLARLVLIESPDASLAGLLGAVKLANAMGAGVVSMSFGAPEGNWTASVDASFAAGGMSYVAATGDSGSGVSWPAVSSNVLAVGGTSLTYSGLGPRSETTWAQSGGGISAYTPTPAYQSNAVPGVGTLAHRAVADVAFNADPSTGQYVAVMTPGRTTASWVSAGGTSLATPQWAGLAAVANAMRASAGAARLAAPHAALYTQLATVPGVYAATFADVQAGANGSCARCAAQVGYDLPTGLGTPNAGALLSALAGPAFAPAVVASTLPPSVAAAALTGTARTALTGSIAVSDPAGAALQVTITGVPAGMAFSVSGQTVLLSWPSPLAGKYTLGFTARNGAGLSGKAAMPVTIDAR